MKHQQLITQIHDVPPFSTCPTRTLLLPCSSLLGLLVEEEEGGFRRRDFIVWLSAAMRDIRACARWRFDEMVLVVVLALVGRVEASLFRAVVAAPAAAASTSVSVDGAVGALEAIAGTCFIEWEGEGDGDSAEQTVLGGEVETADATGE